MKYIYCIIILFLSACSIIRFSNNNRNQLQIVTTLPTIPEDWALLGISDYKIYFSAAALVNSFRDNNTIIYPENTINSIDSLFKKTHLIIKKINESYQIDTTMTELGEYIEGRIDDLLKSGNVFVENKIGKIEKIKYTLIKPESYGGIYSEWATLDEQIINRVLLDIVIY